MRFPPFAPWRHFAVFAVLAAAGLAQKADKAKAPVEVLFVGNSYTYFHDLPAMVQALGAAASPPRAIHTTLLAPGGCTLQKHWEATGKDAPREVLTQLHPAFVVLQEQSRMPLDDEKGMLEYAGRFAKLCKQQKCTAVWYATWARKAEPEAQDRISAAYAKAQKDGGGVLAPVGTAWQRAFAAKGDEALHDADGSHPSPLGSYLAACVLYATMFGGDVGKFPDKLVAKGEDGKERVLVDLPADVGKRLREAAAKALAR